ncbi:2-nitropropane dioxygenase [Mycena olivaceomarginata]|nr:2-nitropropane dioxygenase [Mycena olivaceomarginata]
MIQIKTQLTVRLNITSPIISAPMAEVATPELAAAVSAAGGFGSIGAGLGKSSSQLLKEHIQKIRTSLNIPAGESVPVAVGFLGWVLDKTEISDDPRLPAVLDEHPVAVWFAFGVDIEKWVDQVHEHDTRTGRKTFVFVIVSSVDDARRAAQHGVDAVVVQGNEAGGHGGSEAPPLLVLLAAVLRDFQPREGKPLIVAAGGIATGAQIAGLLAMGADGVVLGTRFLFTHECGYTSAKKQAIMKADLNSTLRTTAFDEAARLTSWPPKCDGRAIANGLIDDYKAGLSLEERIERYTAGVRDGDQSRDIVWAGVGVGLTSEIEGAANVFRALHEETVEHLRCATSLLA